MNFYARGFNLYLLAAALLCGCATDKNKGEFLGTLRVHVENRGNLPDGVQTIKVIRADPVSVTIDPNSILSEGNIINLTVIETAGGWALKVKFDESGTWILEQNSAANPGRHFAIFGQWDKNPTDGRWLAAPLIHGRIANGTLIFDADCSREEADKLAKNVTLAAQKIHTGTLK